MKYDREKVLKRLQEQEQQQKQDTGGGNMLNQPYLKPAVEKMTGRRTSGVVYSERSQPRSTQHRFYEANAPTDITSVTKKLEDLCSGLLDLVASSEDLVLAERDLVRDAGQWSGLVRDTINDFVYTTTQPKITALRQLISTFGDITSEASEVIEFLLNTPTEQLIDLDSPSVVALSSNNVATSNTGEMSIASSIPQSEIMQSQQSSEPVMEQRYNQYANRNSAQLRESHNRVELPAAPLPPPLTVLDMSRAGRPNQNQQPIAPAINLSEGYGQSNAPAPVRSDRSIFDFVDHSNNDFGRLLVEENQRSQRDFGSNQSFEMPPAPLPQGGGMNHIATPHNMQVQQPQGSSPVGMGNQLPTPPPTNGLQTLNLGAVAQTQMPASPASLASKPTGGLAITDAILSGRL